MAGLQDKALERQIFEEEEAAQLHKHGRFEGETKDPRHPEGGTTAAEENEMGKGQADQLSLNSSSSTGQGKAKEKEGSKEQHLAEALVMLIVDTKEHLEELIRSDGGSGGKTIESVVNNLMGGSLLTRFFRSRLRSFSFADEQDFSSRNRTKVQNDDNLRRFLCMSH